MKKRLLIIFSVVVSVMVLGAFVLVGVVSCKEKEKTQEIGETISVNKEEVTDSEPTKEELLEAIKEKKLVEAVRQKKLSLERARYYRPVEDE